MRGRKKFARTEGESGRKVGNFAAKFGARYGIFELTKFEKNPAESRSRENFEKVANSHTLGSIADCRAHKAARLSGEVRFLPDGGTDAKKLPFEWAGGDAGGAGKIRPVPASARPVARAEKLRPRSFEDWVDRDGWDFFRTPA